MFVEYEELELFMQQQVNNLVHPEQANEMSASKDELSSIFLRKQIAASF